MRYILETNDEEGIIGMQIAKWEKDKKLTLFEKGEPIVAIQEQLERVAKALEVLRKAGYNSRVMRTWIKTQTGLSMEIIDAVLNSQTDFFKQIGVKI